MVIFPKSKEVSRTAARGAAGAAGMGRTPQVMAPAHNNRKAPMHLKKRGCRVVLRLSASIT
jgi:hypothetical protein